VIEDIIAYSCSDLRIILNVEQFMKCLREGLQIAVDFMCKNAKGMLDILFVDYDKISTEQYDVYSGLISKIWEVVELN
jgi:arginyl-tRNA synthetase